MKRASVSFDATDVEKLKYQTLLKEYLELQKEYVSRKRKLQAAKQKRKLSLAEVRFLKRKHKCLLESKFPNHLTNTLQGGRNLSSVDQLLLSNDGEAEGSGRVYEEDVRRTKKIKGKICWLDQVTLNVK